MSSSAQDAFAALVLVAIMDVGAASVLTAAPSANHLQPLHGPSVRSIAVPSIHPAAEVAAGAARSDAASVVPIEDYPSSERSIGSMPVDPFGAGVISA